MSFIWNTIVVLHDTISRSVSNNHYIFDKRVGLGSIAAISLTRCFSSSRSFNSIRPYNPESLALQHINRSAGKPTTSSVINKVLLNQNLLVRFKIRRIIKSSRNWNGLSYIKTGR